MGLGMRLMFDRCMARMNVTNLNSKKSPPNISKGARDLFFSTGRSR